MPSFQPPGFVMRFGLSAFPVLCLELSSLCKHGLAIPDSWILPWENLSSLPLISSHWFNSMSSLHPRVWEQSHSRVYSVCFPQCWGCYLAEFLYHFRSYLAQWRSSIANLVNKGTGLSGLNAFWAPDSHHLILDSECELLCFCSSECRYKYINNPVPRFQSSCYACGFKDEATVSGTIA